MTPRVGFLAALLLAPLSVQTPVRSVRAAIEASPSWDALVAPSLAFMPIASLLLRNPSSGAAPGHRYWRINVTANAGSGASTSFAEVEMRTSVGGADVTGSGTASGGGGFTGSTPANAFDNNSSTLYAPSGSSGWLKYDFGVNKDIVEIAISHGGGAGITTMPQTFTIQYSDDDSSWTTLGSTINAYGWIDNATRVFPETPVSGYHRYWRINATTSTGTRTNLAEMEFAATAAGADQCTGGKPYKALNAGSSAPYTDSSAPNLTDNSTATEDGQVATTCVFGYIFPNPVAVQEVRLTGSANTTRDPQNFTIQSSDDGSSWTTEKTVTGASWTANEVKTYSVP